MTTDSSKVVLDIPRDRNGTFDPMLIAKYQRRFPEFDRKIISMYARGMTTREIQGHIEEIYGVEASPSLISATTSVPRVLMADTSHFSICLSRFTARLNMKRDVGRIKIMRSIRWLTGCALALAAGPLSAADITAKYYPAGMLTPARVSVSVNGEIARGDAGKLKSIITREFRNDGAELLISFDSPGGSLMEGLLMGRVIAGHPYIRSYTSVADRNFNPRGAICASACVYAFLGGDFRALDEGARIGVHKFYASNEIMTGSEGLSAAQTLSGEIVSFLRSQKVDVTFFDEILAAEGDEINWVPVSKLAEMKVIHNGSRGEQVDYRNVNGMLTLRIEQDASVGTNTIRLMCGEGKLSGVAFLQEPANAVPTGFALSIGDQEYRPETWEVVSRDNYTSSVAFVTTPQMRERLIATSAIGARLYNGPYVFYGFQGEVRDEKIAEMAESCMSRSVASSSSIAPRGAAGPTPSRLRQSYNRIPGHDLEGGDLTKDGFRNVSMSDCEDICTRMDGCLGVAYVERRQWCWPKNGDARFIERKGVTAAIVAH